MKQRRHSLRHLLARTVAGTVGAAGVATGVYPVANQIGTAVSRAVARRRQPKGLVAAIASEWAMAGLVTAARPLGLFGLPLLGGQARGPRPVLLLHGFLMGRMNFCVMANRLRIAGIGPLVGFEYWTLGPLTEASASLARFVDEVRAETGAAQVDLVGHSLGGVVARHYVCAGAGAAHVKNLVTIGSPHGGTPMSRFGFGKAAQEMAVDSDVLRALGQAPLPSAVRMTTIWSRADGLVSSGRFARVPGAEEVVYDDLGHLAMLASPRVAREVVERLWRE